MATLEEGKVQKGRVSLWLEEMAPYKLMQKVGDNTYKIELADDMNIFTTFNVGDLTPYIEDKDEGREDLRANSIQGRG